jgi:hypothetical protein
MPWVTGGYLQQSAHAVEHAHAVYQARGVGFEHEQRQSVDEHPVDHERGYEDQRVGEVLPLVDDEVRTLE